MASASYHSSSSARGFQYDVFLSFRGSDARKGIASELHHQLTERGIETFMDTNLQVGDVISPAFLKAIQKSRFAIVILSPNYASSTWCLQELAMICQCMEYNDRILPLFFDVEPDDVRFLKRSFEAAFTNYENSGLYRSEKLQEWKDALTKVANCKGWNSNKYKTKRELVKKIVEDMCSKVQPIENNKGDHEKFVVNINMGKQDDVITGVGRDFIKGVSWNFFKDVKGYTIGHINSCKQGDVVSDVSGDFIKDVSGDLIKDVKSDIIKGGPSGDIIRGDRGGDGGDS